MNLNITYSGFRYSAFHPGGEYYHHPFCRYVKQFPSHLPEESRICDKVGVYHDNRIVPACEDHIELYDFLLSAFAPESNDQHNVQHSPPLSDSSSVSLENIPKKIDLADECCVCESKENKLMTPCLHVICFSCYQNLKTRTCPLCRTSLEKFVYRL